MLIYLSLRLTLTVAASFNLLSHQDDDLDEEEEERRRNEVVISGSKIMQSVKFEPAQAKREDESENSRAPGRELVDRAEKNQCFTIILLYLRFI